MNYEFYHRSVPLHGIGRKIRHSTSKKQPYLKKIFLSKKTGKMSTYYNFLYFCTLKNRKQLKQQH